MDKICMSYISVLNAFYCQKSEKFETVLTTRSLLTCNKWLSCIQIKLTIELNFKLFNPKYCLEKNKEMINIMCNVMCNVFNDRTAHFIHGSPSTVATFAN